MRTTNAVVEQTRLIGLVRVLCARATADAAAHRVPSRVAASLNSKVIATRANAEVRILSVTSFESERNGYRTNEVYVYRLWNPECYGLAV